MDDPSRFSGQVESERTAGVQAWAAATWTAALVGGVFAAVILGVDGATDGSMVATAGFAGVGGVLLAIGGIVGTRRSVDPRVKQVSIAVIAGVVTVAVVYGISAFA